MDLETRECTSIKRSDLVDLMRRAPSKQIVDQIHHLEEELLKTINEDQCKRFIIEFKTEFKKRWTRSHRCYTKFYSSNKKWLEENVRLEKKTLRTGCGRPMKNFQSSSERTKQVKTRKIREDIPLCELSYATQSKLYSEGNRIASHIVKEVTLTTPTRPSKYKMAYEKSLKEKETGKMAGEEALAMMVNAKLSRHQYEVVRDSAADRFPSYKVVQVAKRLCYPDNILITETSASVPLQQLLDHTARRLIQSIEEVVKTHVAVIDFDKLCLISKWGFDGSSGHSSYKQAFHGTGEDDSSVFITCLVPLRLMCNNKVIWENPCPASTVYCRPLKMEFVKESSDVSVAEKKRVDREINSIENSLTNLEDRTVQVKHNLIFAMVDGKVCNAISETKSTQKCFLCGATSAMFNKIEDMIKREVNKQHLAFGLSVLHGWIRMFEFLLHVAYKLPIKKWQARGAADKSIVAENKARIQKEFRERSGLIVDVPKPGFGNSNDGNTARRFFKNAEVSAEITKLDLQLIKKIHVIMIVVASGHEIDIQKFRAFLHETARYYVKLYPWYSMPPTVHKYLIHGPEIIKSALLPIGQLSEEAQEARNKDFKRYRENNARKCNRKSTNADVFNLFLVTSDPLITSKRNLKPRKKENIPPEALEFLKASSPFDDEEEEESDFDF